MEVTESTIEIDAPRQTVWSILDDLPRYSEWNSIIPRLEGRTTLGEMLTGDLVIPGMPTQPLMPTITRVVAGRELRWLSRVPGDKGFTAEHIFILEPSGTGTRLIHREEFDGPAAPFLAEPLRLFIHPAYVSFNEALKARAEAALRGGMALHPALDAAKRLSATTSELRCLCPDKPVQVSLSAPLSHNHLCGCSKCWKPDGAVFAQTAVVPSDAAEITANAEKLKVVDETQPIKRHACVSCGVHMVGTVDDRDHHFFGLAFVHPELSGADTGKPEFAGFVSSIVETGTPGAAMRGIRSNLRKHDIPAFDGFSAELMDIIAYHRRKIARTTSRPGSA